MKKKLRTLRIVFSNMFRDKLCLTANECEISAYFFSVIGMCRTSIRYTKCGLLTIDTTSDIKASLYMSVAVSLLRLRKPDSAERYFETACLLLRQQEISDTLTIHNARKNKERYDKITAQLDSTKENSVSEH